MTLAHPDFVSCGEGVPSSLRVGVALLGTVDGVNKVFSAPDDFVHDGVKNERVYLRGLRQLEGVGSDYVVSESGGPGTGYDTITFTDAPEVGDVLTADYYIT